MLVDAIEKVVGKKDVSASFTSDGKFIDAFVSILEDYENAMDKIICGNNTEFDGTNWYHDAMDEIIHPKESAIFVVTDWFPVKIRLIPVDLPFTGILRHGETSLDLSGTTDGHGLNTCSKNSQMPRYFTEGLFSVLSVMIVDCSQ